MIRWFVEHPVAVWMVFGALLVSGLYALPRLNVEAMPESDLPSLTVYTNWTGASPSAVQRAITIPIEEAVRGVYGVEEVKARSAPGRSQVEVAFRREVDLDFARLDLSEQLGAVRRQLPPSATQPMVVPFVPEEFRTQEFFSCSLVSPLPTNELRDRAERWLLPRLLAVPGVADAELQGGALPVLKVLLDQGRLERYGVPADLVWARLAERDDIVPAGAVRRQGCELSVTVQERVTAASLAQTVLRLTAGQPLTLADVGSVRPDYEDPSYFVRINGENVVQVTAEKRSGENAVGVSRRLRAAMPEIAAAMPFPLDFEIDRDLGRDLEQKLKELVWRSLIILALLALLLAAGLRRVRLTLIVLSSILLATGISLALFYFCGISVNFITISGLTVCFGMLLDNSILVLDAIHRRLGAAGPQAAVALVEGTREVAFPIVATTVTTVVAFLSFVFLSGRLSLYYIPLALSVGIALLASILVAFAWLPVALRGAMAAEARRPPAPPRRRWWRGPRPSLAWLLAIALAAAATAAGGALVGGPRIVSRHWPWGLGLAAILVGAGELVIHSRALTAFALRRWRWAALLMLGLAAGVWWVFRHEVSHGGFWRQQDPEVLVAYIERPVGTDVLLATETMRGFEQVAAPLPDGAHMKTWSYENRAGMEVRFDPPLKKTAWPEMTRNRLILHAENLGGMFIWINGFGDPYMKGGMGGGLSNSLLKLTGYNSKRLAEISEGIMGRLERNRRVRNVRLTSGDRFDRAAADETVVLIDRARLRSADLTPAEVVGHLRRLIGSDVPWQMLLDGEDRRVQLSFADAEAIQRDQVLGRVITTSGGGRHRLGDLVSLQRRPVLGSINREDQRYTMQVNWEYVGTDRMRKRFLDEIIAGLELPYGYTAEDVSGEALTEEEQEEMRQMLWLTLLFIFMTMAALFENLALPLLILLAVPMSLVGVAAIFWATGATFDSSARIGLVLLFGVVVNNAILLVNRFRLQVRLAVAARGYPAALVPPKTRLGGFDLRRLPPAEADGLLRAAIVDGVRVQMRSVLLTSGTTVAGLLPLLIRLTSAQEGRDIWENLALSSIGGLTSSTLLILTVLPALYFGGTRCAWWILAAPGRLRDWIRRGPGAGTGQRDPVFSRGGRSPWLSPNC